MLSRDPEGERSASRATGGATLMERTSVIDLCLACSIALGVLSGHESDPHAPHPSEIMYQVGGTGKPAIVSFASNPRVQPSGGRIRVTTNGHAGLLSPPPAR